MNNIVEIKAAIDLLKLQNEVILFNIESFVSKSIIKELKQTFVNNEPRVWWLDFKYKPTSYTFNTMFLYKKISDFFSDQEIVWVVVEDDVNILMMTSIENFIKIIGECKFFEYNIINLSLTKLLCENDHNELLFVDINSSGQ